ncbi:hypothetical protein LIPSTDRAFT_241342 [Lipomyces starkeyi NRRL Y-11557]|uniref:Uncharacterized protein n=1 Tax=Lipomyces starkeyi NRRL Y-11557 TaxID=675824 RepID=A0A1E3QCP2_LIPST|nr:hypothetical protein LIPSTDRAFT_241342 [Lipomyces starkeyi NRRL Y-11557]
MTSSLASAAAMTSSLASSPSAYDDRFFNPRSRSPGPNFIIKKGNGISSTAMNPNNELAHPMPRFSYITNPRLSAYTKHLNTIRRQFTLSSEECEYGRDEVAQHVISQCRRESLADDTYEQ